MRACRPARALLAAAVLAAPAPAFASASALARPADAEARAALDLVYDGDFHGAEARLAALAREHPDDPVLPYLQALALEWRLEQDPASRAHDAEVLALADRALALAGVQLAPRPRGRRALLARGAAHGVKSRLHLFRWEKGPASREAVRMREALARRAGRGRRRRSTSTSASASTTTTPTPCPRFFKLVAFVLRIPGGDRERGLERVARVARGGSLFHDDEARVQMYDIHSYFERKPDRALHWIREMWRLHPGWPIWGLKLAQLLGEPMGLWAESAAVAREILATAEEGRHPNYQPVVAAMARVLLAEALLGDLRFEEAREAALGARSGAPGTPWVAERAERVLARCLDLERRAGSPEALRASRCSRRRGGCASRATRPPPRRPVGGRSSPSRASDEGRLCAARESLRRDGPRRRESSRARSSRARGSPGCGPSRASCSRGRSRRGRARAGARPLPPRVGGAARAGGAARRGGRGDPAPRARDDAARRAAARAVGTAPRDLVFKVPYKNHPSRPVPHIFVARGGRRYQTAASRQMIAENGSRSLL